MESRHNKYTSMFKIDNVPILPPLMTDDKRQEMRRYKELALAIEMKLRLEAGAEEKLAPEKEPPPIELVRKKSCEDEYLQLTKLLQEKSDGVMEVLYKKEKALHREQLKKSDTFIYDIITNTVIMPYDLRHNQNHCNNAYTAGWSKEEIQKIEFHDTNKISHNKPKADERNLPSPTKGKTEWCLSRSPRKEAPLRNTYSTSQVPQISVKPPTPEYKVPSRENLSNTFAENSATQPSRESNERRHEPKTNSYRELGQRTPDSRHSSCRTETNMHTPRRSTTSPSLVVGEIAPRLIRSNSFTLESPSNALLQHLAAQGSSTFESETTSSLKQMSSEVYLPSEDSARRRTKSENKSESGKLKEDTSAPKNRKINTLLITNSTMYKNKKSPYDVKLCGRTKILKKHKNPVVRTVSAISIKHRTRHSSKKNEEKSSNQTNSSDTSNINEVFRGMDEAQKHRLLELIKKQEEEQKRMHENFEKQQRMLLQELSNSTISTALGNCDFDYSEEPDSKSIEIVNLKPSQDSSKHSLGSKQEDILYAKNAKNIISHKIVLNLQNSKEQTKGSPRRRLFVDDQTNKSRERPGTPTKRREKAATTLQAYVRGFLVRRLFRTKHVEKLVQIIRDTLLFVLKLHMETRYDNSENNIRLKARLLQQLSSSSEALRKIFFEVSTKERMQIIRKDRLFAAKDSARSPRKK